MARWNEEQERWTGRGDRYGEDERRFRGERGEESGWRGRDWRDDERYYGSRGGGGRDESWRDMGRGGSEREDEWGGGRSFGERGGGGGMYGGRGMYGAGEYGGGGQYSGRGYGGGGFERGERGDYTTYGSSSGGGGYGRDEGMRDRWRGERGFEEDRWRGERRFGGDDRGPMERMGDALKEGMRKLTGKGPKGYRRSDDRVRDEVCERIARSGVDADEVDVKVEKGEVTLTGFVERREEKRALEDIAEDVFGVDEVHNHLRMRRQGQETFTTSTTGAATAGTGTTGTGAAMSGRQQTTTQPPHQGRH